jgi:hypothetical protein
MHRSYVKRSARATMGSSYDMPRARRGLPRGRGFFRRPPSWPPLPRRRHPTPRKVPGRARENRLRYTVNGSRRSRTMSRPSRSASAFRSPRRKTGYAGQNLRKLALRGSVGGKGRRDPPFGGGSPEGLLERNGEIGGRIPRFRRYVRDTGVVILEEQGSRPAHADAFFEFVDALPDDGPEQAVEVEGEKRQRSAILGMGIRRSGFW